MGINLNYIANGLSNLVNKGTKAIVNSKIIPNTAKGLYNTAKPIGKAAFNVGLKTGATTLSTTANVVQGVRNNQNTIKKVGKAVFNGGKSAVKGVGTGIIHEGSAVLQAGSAALDWVLDESHGIVKRVGMDKSLVGHLFTKKAVLGLTAGALLTNSVKSGANYLTEGRMGRNDGQLHRLTPAAVNPYEISSQMAGSQMGASYADNAGATGDLTLALYNNNRR